MFEVTSVFIYQFLKNWMLPNSLLSMSDPLFEKKSVYLRSHFLLALIYRSVK
jgi:hypothetical protein